MSLRIPVSENDHVQGGSHAIVELVEYGDYQCPHCGRAYWVVKKLQQHLGAQLRFVFRNFPLAEVHPHAKAAAMAAEAAGLQGKFWEMHDLLFEHQNRLNTASLKDYASQLQLDIQLFEIDLNSRSLSEKIEAEFYSGMRSGVNATPGFFINGEKFNGDWEDDGLLNFINMNYGSA